MIAVIQCAGKKQPDAGSLRARGGKEVFFVAEPAKAPHQINRICARPDDRSDSGPSWRELLLEYNANPGGNPLGLYPAYALYHNATYQRLVERLGLEKTFILSAGWGLIPASFLTPNYDITFSASGDSYTRRKKSEEYSDFCMLPNRSDEDVYFFGGKDYVPLFCKLTAGYQGKRVLFYNSASLPQAPGCELRRFETSTRTNWHYECANAFISAEPKNGVVRIVSKGSQIKPHVRATKVASSKTERPVTRNLLSLDDAAIRGAISKARKGIAQYLWLMRSLHLVNVSTNREFQRRYNSFYRVRQRSPDWYSAYYDLLEQRKNTGIGFQEALDTLWQRLGRYEPSFSSKLVATIEPTTPVWDRFVLMNTGLRPPSYVDPQKIPKAKAVYRQICDWYATHLASADGRRLIEIFDEEVPENKEISELKKLDFVLWQSRS